jgi:hypothetical protein
VIGEGHENDGGGDKTLSSGTDRGRRSSVSTVLGLLGGINIYLQWCLLVHYGAETLQLRS